MKKEKRDYFIKQANLEVRELENGTKTIVGLIPYNSRSEDMGFYEVLNPGCFTKTLSENRIVALWNHDSSKVLGNNKAGTLKFEDRDDGLFCIVELPNTSFGNDAYESVRSGNVTTMSFGFSAIKESYNSKENQRNILEARLFECSFGVPFPAYEGTKSIVQLRNYILNERKIDISNLESILAKEVLDDEDKKVIADTISNLSTLVEVEEHFEPEKPLKAVDEIDVMLLNLDEIE